MWSLNAVGCIDSAAYAKLIWAFGLGKGFN